MRINTLKNIRFYRFLTIKKPSGHIDYLSYFHSTPQIINVNGRNVSANCRMTNTGMGSYVTIWVQ